MIMFVVYATYSYPDFPDILESIPVGVYTTLDKAKEVVEEVDRDYKKYKAFANIIQLTVDNPPVF